MDERPGLAAAESMSAPAPGIRTFHMIEAAADCLEGALLHLRRRWSDEFRTRVVTKALERWSQRITPSLISRTRRRRSPDCRAKIAEVAHLTRSERVTFAFGGQTPIHLDGQRPTEN